MQDRLAPTMSPAGTCPGDYYKANRKNMPGSFLHLADNCLVHLVVCGYHINVANYSGPSAWAPAKRWSGAQFSCERSSFTSPHPHGPLTGMSVFGREVKEGCMETGEPKNLSCAMH